MSTLIKLKSVERHHSSGQSHVRAVDGVDLEISEGEFVALVGPSGSGKSTLISLIAGLDRPTSGEVWFDGQPIHSMSDEELAQFRRKQLGFVFQSFQLFDTFTALENVSFPLEMLGLPTDKAQTLLETVGLADRMDHFPAQLSGGEKQRVAIARAFAASPKLLLADEPTGNLDEENGEMVMGLFSALREANGATVILVTHDPEVAAAADRVLRMRGGRLEDAE